MRNLPVEGENLACCGSIVALLRGDVGNRYPGSGGSAIFDRRPGTDGLPTLRNLYIHEWHSNARRHQRRRRYRLQLRRRAQSSTHCDSAGRLQYPGVRAVGCTCRIPDLPEGPIRAHPPPHRLRPTIAAPARHGAARRPRGTTAILHGCGSSGVSSGVTGRVVPVMHLIAFRRPPGRPADHHDGASWWLGHAG